MVDQPSLEDALAYISHVKQALLNFHPTEGINKYNQFGDALHQFYQKKFTAQDSIAVIQTLLESHENLLSGFKKFLTKDQETKRVTNFSEIGINPDLELRRRKCIEFISKVEHQFENHPDVYETFLDILIEYNKGDLTINKVYKNIYMLFFGHTDLVVEFESFFSDADEEVKKTNDRIRGFVNEDWLHEVDNLLSKLRSAIVVAEKVIFGGCFDDDDDDDHDAKFTDMNLRCIEKLYGDFGEEVVQLLVNDPERVCPVVLRRLKQKEMELSEIRSFINNFLRECHCRRRM